MRAIAALIIGLLPFLGIFAFSFYRESHLHLPKPPSYSETQLAQSISLHLGMDGVVSYRGQPLDENQLQAFLKDKHEEDRKRIVFIATSPKTAVKHVIKTRETILNLGFRRVELKLEDSE